VQSRADRGTMRKLSVLMPVYNERWTLEEIVRRVLAAPISLEVELIAVDDASTDGSGELLVELAAREPRIRVVRHTENRGKGAAIRSAIEHITGDVAVIQDADLEYDPQDLPDLLMPILEGKADAVFGSRFAGHVRRVLFFWHSLVNQGLTLISNMLNDLNLTDMETCYKLFRAEIIKKIHFRENRFGFEPEVTAKIARFKGIRIYEVGISYYGRTYEEGKKIGARDGFRAIWCILKYNLINKKYLK
jgi:glycosyltransferase involved in cell wall biosynthesis